MKQDMTVGLHEILVLNEINRMARSTISEYSETPKINTSELRENQECFFAFLLIDVLESSKLGKAERSILSFIWSNV